MRAAILLGLSVILTGCASGSSAYYTQSVQSWRGGTVKDLFSVWGRPDEIMPGPGGKTIFVYKRQGFVNTNTNYSPSIGVRPKNGATIVTSTPNARTPWNKGFTAYCISTFTANPTGKVVDTEIEGTNCYISQSGAARLANPR